MKFGYTIIYVANVVETIEFYENAFGLERQFIHESNLYAELKTGDTVLAFAGDEMAEMNGFTIYPNKKTTKPAGFDVCFLTDNVQKAFDHALNAGAQSIAPPTQKPWGQTVAYLRDLNGCLVEIATPIVT